MVGGQHRKRGEHLFMDRKIFDSRILCLPPDYYLCYNPMTYDQLQYVMEVGMTKAELVDLIMADTGVSKRDTALIINHILENISDALIKGDKIELRGFGSFKVKNRRPRQARNPRTGEAVSVQGKRVPFFKASNEMKQKINGEGELSGSKAPAEGI